MEKAKSVFVPITTQAPATTTEAPETKPWTYQIEQSTYHKPFFKFQNNQIQVPVYSPIRVGYPSAVRAPIVSANQPLVLTTVGWGNWNRCF